MTTRVVRWILAALAAVPMAVAVGFVAARAEPVPFWDEWVEPLDVAIRTAEGTLTPADLVRQYNDSRPLFTNLITAASTALLDWNLKAEMLFNQLLASATLVLLFLLLRRRIGGGALAMLPVMALLVFALTQRRSLLWAIQSQVYVMVLFVVAAAWVLDRGGRRWRDLALAALLAAGATFSFANGLAAWFALAPVVWLAGYRAPRFVALWAGAAAVTLGLFFLGYAFRPAVGSGLAEPAAAVEFVLAFLGNALVGHHGPASPGRLAAVAAVGFVGLALLIADLLWLRRRTERAADWAVWAGLALFVVMSAGVAALGRVASEGLASALANRYVTLSLLFWAALAGLAATVVHRAVGELGHEPSARPVAAVNVVVGAALVGLLVVSSAASLSLPLRVTPAHRECLERAPVTRDLSCLEGLHPVFDPDHPSHASRHLALEKIDRLADLGLGVFSDRR